jgi:hypothetical protein
VRGSSENNSIAGRASVVVSSSFFRLEQLRARRFKLIRSREPTMRKKSMDERIDSVHGDPSVGVLDVSFDASKLACGRVLMMV